MGGVAKAITSVFVPQDPPKPKKTEPLPQTDPNAAEVAAREETLKRSRRGLAALQASGPRGVLTPASAASSPLRKTLLGE